MACLVRVPSTPHHPFALPVNGRTENLCSRGYPELVTSAFMLLLVPSHGACRCDRFCLRNMKKKPWMQQDMMGSNTRTKGRGQKPSDMLQLIDSRRWLPSAHPGTGVTSEESALEKVLGKQICQQKKTELAPAGGCYRPITSSITSFVTVIASGIENTWPHWWGPVSWS